MSYKLLWYSIPSLFDTSSGAAIRCRLMLKKLQERGIEVHIITAGIADDPSGITATMSKIQQAVAEQTKPEQTPPDSIRFDLDGMSYLLIPTHSSNFEEINQKEQSQLYAHFCNELMTFQPDLIMGYSGDVFSASLRHEAKSRGIPVVYALCNGSHLTFGFPDCDLVFTTSQATCDFYKERTGIKVKAVGNFIDPAMVLATPEERKPEYVTMINPSPAKGIAIFIKLILAYSARHPEEQQKFLLVKSRGNFVNIMRSLHLPNGTPLLQSHGQIAADTSEQEWEQLILQALPQLYLAEHTPHIAAVYGLTKALVAPSVWHESWGRVATEANINGIPALVSNSGGLPEAIGIDQTLDHKQVMPTYGRRNCAMGRCLRAAAA